MGPHGPNPRLPRKLSLVESIIALGNGDEKGAPSQSDLPPPLREGSGQSGSDRQSSSPSDRLAPPTPDPPVSPQEPLDDGFQPQEMLDEELQTTTATSAELALDDARLDEKTDIADGMQRAQSPGSNGLQTAETKVTIQEDVEGGDEEQEEETNVNVCRENVKLALAIVFMMIAFACIFIGLIMGASGKFTLPQCKELRKQTRIRSCKKCGVGTNIFPLFGEWERTWNKHLRAALYLFGTFWIFQGMGIVCDQFMAGIEAITAAERVVWRETEGVKRKFRVKVWNGTVANLTLMALGSSAPEILLTATELMGNDFFSASLGPQTIVGSAAFNLFVISAVCITAIPAPETKQIECIDAFKVTATFSVFAYLWLLLILSVFSPQRVEIWEGIVTLLWFAVLIVVAFLADKGLLRSFVTCKAMIQKEEEWNEEVEQARAVNVYGKELPLDTLKRLKYGFEQHDMNHSKVRTNLSKVMGGPKLLSRSQSNFGAAPPESEPSTRLGFAEKKQMVLECAGYVSLKVSLSAALEWPVTVSYCTRDGSARANLRYKEIEGTLTFEPGVCEMFIDVALIDDNHWQPEENFMVELYDLQVDIPSARDDVSGQSNDMCAIKDRVVTVVVLNDDIAGTIVFSADEVLSHQGTTAVVEVQRTHGSCGEVSVKYETIDDSAVKESDYEHTQGTLCFANGEKLKTISIPIVPSDDRAQERFKLRLSEPSNGAIFDATTDGGADFAICDIIIAAAGNAPFYLRWFRMCFNEDRWTVTKELWAEQRSEMLYCGGSIEDQAEAGLLSWIQHILELNWKLIFLLTPPPLLGGGWPCFFVALFWIGCVTMLAGDLASLLGCCLGIPDDITAITLIALGTSLPDTLASRTAAQQDDFADNAIGNVTGSNSVNVFLGAGISWTIGAVHWHMKGPTEDWKKYKSHDGKTFEYLFLDNDKYPNGGFIVPIPSLAFSVSVYSGCAAICLTVLAVRRKYYGGELGGQERAQYIHASILFSLWVVFIAAVSVYSIVTN